MRKGIILLLICLNLVQAKVQNVELLADSVTQIGEMVNANGNVIAYSQDYFLTADRAVYDKKNESIFPCFICFYYLYMLIKCI